LYLRLDAVWNIRARYWGVIAAARRIRVPTPGDCRRATRCGTSPPFYSNS